MINFYIIVSNETFNKSDTNNLKIKLKNKSYEKEMEKPPLLMIRFSVTTASDVFPFSN
ncbi:MAG: hypothetical protein AB2376_16570 [Clostridium sp.]